MNHFWQILAVDDASVRKLLLKTFRYFVFNLHSGNSITNPWRNAWQLLEFRWRSHWSFWWVFRLPSSLTFSKAWSTCPPINPFCLTPTWLYDGLIQCWATFFCGWHQKSSEWTSQIPSQFGKCCKKARNFKYFENYYGAEVARHWSYLLLIFTFSGYFGWTFEQEASY